MSEKLQKILARTGHGSRREIEDIIKQGRVSINGNIATLGDRLEVTRTTKIRIDSNIINIKPIEYVNCHVLAYYKPAGELCTRYDPQGRPTVFDHLPHIKNAHWVAVGRLDINTSGLLLFTTDGELAHRLMHPSFQIEREYAVRIFGMINKEKLRQLKDGIQLTDGLAAFRHITYQGGKGLNQWYNVTLTEGYNREVRRLWEAVGVQVSRLIRVRYDKIMLPKWLPCRGWTTLSLDKTNYLRKKVKLSY